MKRTQKLISGLISTAMVLSAVSNVFAYDNFVSADMNDVIYSYADEDNQINEVTKQELVEGGWNLENLAGEPAELYEDFPMSVESSMNNRAELSLNLLYLKQIGEGDSVSFSIEERDTNIPFLERDITSENDFISIDNIPIGKVYNFEINEILGGESKTYRAVVTTDYESAAFPSNISVTSVTNAEGVMLKIDEARTENNADEELEDYLIPA